MMSFSVKADVKEVKRKLNDVQRKEIPGAVSSALNRAVSKTRTQSIRDSSRALNIKQSVIRKRLRFQKRDKATRRKWEAGVFTVVSDIPVSELGKPRQLRKGAKVGRKMYPGAFVATMHGRGGGGGHTGIYRRAGKTRLPITEMRVPIRRTVEPIVLRNIERIGMTEFRKRFHHEIKRRLKRKGLL